MLLQPAAAAADEPAGAQSGPVREWYGWQTLTSDGVAALLVGGAFAVGHGAGASVLGWTGYVGYLGGAAVIHAAHGRPGMAVGDAVLRLFVPLVGALIGSAVGTSSSCGSGGDIGFGICALNGAFVGGAAGASIPIALDAGFFAYRTHWVDGSSNSATSLRVDPGPHHFSLAVVGQF